MRIVSSLRREGKRIVFTNGCFDVLHIGHIRCLHHARTLGGALIVGLNSDASVRILKGSPRPFVPQSERAEMLAALSFVDYVVIFPELTPDSLLQMIRPDIHVKGGDYRGKKLRESRIVRAYGGKVVIWKKVKGKSTTMFLSRVVYAYGGN